MRDAATFAGHDIRFCIAAGARTRSTLVLRILRFFEGNGPESLNGFHLPCLATYDVQKIPKIHEKYVFGAGVGLSNKC